MSEFPKPTRRPVLTVASSVRREVQRFLSPGRVPLGAVTILGGFPGLGKSSWGILLAAELSGRDETTVIATAEDSISATVRPRLEAVDANLDRIHFITVQADDGLEDGVEIPRDLLLLEDAMHETGAKLLIVDPLVAHLGDRLDSHRDASVRRALAPLYRLAQTCDAAVLALLHLNKGGVGLQPLARLSGSGAFGAAARSVLLLDRDPDDADGDQGSRRVLAHLKCNVGPLQPSLLYEVTPILLPETPGQPRVDTSRLDLIGESPHSGRALLATTSDDERSALDDAREFLLAELADGERHFAVQLINDGRKLGIADRTLQRARRAIGASTEKRGFGPGARWEWWLAKAPSESRKPAFLHEGVSHQVLAPSGENAVPEGAENGHIDIDADEVERLADLARDMLAGS